MRQILLVVYYFPPLGGIASLRAASYATHLAEFGWNATVLAPANGAYYHDPSLSVPGVRVMRSTSLELSRSGKRLLRAGGSDTTTAQSGGLRSVPRFLARRYLYFPDAQIGWYPFAFLNGRRAMGSTSFDAILSSSAPVTAHLIARALHRQARIPWVAEFRDPWSARMAENDPLRGRASALEKSIAHEASALIMTSPTWSAEHARAWGREVATIPNGHGGEPSYRETPRDFVISYLGSYYPDEQDLTTAWDAIARLRRDGAAGPLRIRFVGELPAVLARELDARGLREVTEVTGFVSQARALQELASSSALLAAGPKDSRSRLRGVIAGKLFDYLATGVPIIFLGATPNDGATMLREHQGCHLVAPGDEDGMVAALTASRGRRYDRDLAGLNRRDRARALAELLDGLAVSGAPRSGQAAKPD